MYTNNPKMPKIRRDAVLFANTHGVRCAARHFDFSPGAIILWQKKAKVIGLHPIPTQSSRPKVSPRAIEPALVEQIVDTRLRVRRSSEVVHRVLEERGVHVSLSTVKRTLDRGGYTKKRSPWKRYHPSSPRPVADAPGALIQADTVHLAIQGKTVLYVFTCVDVYSRWAYASAIRRLIARPPVCLSNKRRWRHRFCFGVFKLITEVSLVLTSPSGYRSVTVIRECDSPMTTHTLNALIGHCVRSVLMHYLSQSPSD